MDLQPAFSPNDLVAHIAGNVANALCAREGEIQQQQDERREAAASTIMAFQPSDAVEAMLASHCVVFHEMIVAGAQETWRYEDPAMLRAKRTTIVAMDKAFGNNLIRLDLHRDRHPERAPAVQPADEHSETEIADRVLRHQPASAHEPRTPLGDQPSGQPPVTAEAGTILRYPPPEASAVSRAGADPAGIPDGAKAARFPHAATVGRPAEAWPATAPNGPTDKTHPPMEPRTANAFAGNRQARRHPSP